MITSRLAFASRIGVGIRPRTDEPTLANPAQARARSGPGTRLCYLRAHSGNRDSSGHGHAVDLQIVHGNTPPAGQQWPPLPAAHSASVWQSCTGVLQVVMHAALTP